MIVICLFCLIVIRELPPHPNIVQVYGVSVNGPQPILVLEYCGGGMKCEKDEK
jgi:serine/threonine protein kinase